MRPWPSAWEYRLSHCQRVFTLTGKCLGTPRLQVQTLLPGAHRDPPQATARGQYSLASFADNGGEIYSEDSSIYHLNSTLSSHNCMGSTRRRNFHLERSEMFLHSCFLQVITLPRILLPASILFDTDLFLFITSLKSCGMVSHVWQGHLYISDAHLCPSFLIFACLTGGLLAIHQEWNSLECQLG